MLLWGKYMYKDYTFINKEVTNTKAINNSIRNILLTHRGTVPGRPRFGSDLHTLLFTQMNSTIINIAKNMIFHSLTEFEDRIEITNIDIKNVEEYNKVVCNIEYKYKDEYQIVSESVNLSLT